MSKPRKSFKDNLNPAELFVSGPEEPAKASATISEKTPEGYKLNPQYVETKSRRLQLLLQPSLYERIKLKATAEESSVNELIHSILEDALPIE